MRRMLFGLILVQMATCASAQNLVAKRPALEAMREDVVAQPEGSLGIGFDVFMQVYGFAAGRVGAPLDLRIISCKSGRCIWAVGDGVILTTEHYEDRLDLHRIEAALDQKGPIDPSLRHRYEQVCLTIVGIVDRQATAADQRATATAIASLTDEKPRNFQLEQGNRDVRIYGKPADLADAARRCGAVALAY